MGRRISHSEERWQQMEWAGSPIVRCAAPTQAGTQCKREAQAGSIVCDKHGAHLPNVQKRAKERYVNLADQARAVVEGILNNPKSSDAAKLKAAEMVMKATGMEDAKKVVVEVETDPWLKLFGKDGSDMLNPAPQPVEPASQPLAIESSVVVPDDLLDAPEDDLRPAPTPENVRPINGWAAVDNAPREKPHAPPKRIRDGIGRLPDGAA